MRERREQKEEKEEKGRKERKKAGRRNQIIFTNIITQATGHQHKYIVFLTAASSLSFYSFFQPRTHSLLHPTKKLFRLPLSLPSPASLHAPHPTAILSFETPSDSFLTPTTNLILPTAFPGVYSFSLSQFCFSSSFFYLFIVLFVLFCCCCCCSYSSHSRQDTTYTQLHSRL